MNVSEETEIFNQYYEIDFLLNDTRIGIINISLTTVSLSIFTKYGDVTTP